MRLKYNQFSENVNLIVTTKIFLLNILDACGECFFPSDTENNPNVLFLSVPVNSPQLQLNLTLSRRRPLSYRNQSIDLLAKSMDWFLYDTASVLKGLNPNQNDINSPYIPFHNESSRWFKKRPLEHSNQIMDINNSQEYSTIVL